MRRLISIVLFCGLVLASQAGPASAASTEDFTCTGTTSWSIDPAAGTATANYTIQVIPNVGCPTETAVETFQALYPNVTETEGVSPGDPNRGLTFSNTFTYSPLQGLGACLGELSGPLGPFTVTGLLFNGDSTNVNDVVFDAHVVAPSLVGNVEETHFGVVQPGCPQAFSDNVAYHFTAAGT